MPLETLEGQTGPNPTAAIVVLHGLGADGNDFVPLAQQLDLSAVGDVRWVFPNAPVRPVTINGGYRMRAWYDILGNDLQRREDEAGLRESTALVLGLIEREIARGVPSRRIVLAGFSQGCAITLLAGLRCPHRLAGLAGMSGYLPLADTLAAEAQAANRGLPLSPIVSVVLDPCSPVDARVLYASVWMHGVFRSADGGASQRAASPHGL